MDATFYHVVSPLETVTLTGASESRSTGWFRGLARTRGKVSTIL